MNYIIMSEMNNNDDAYIQARIQCDSSNYGQ